MGYYDPPDYDYPDQLMLSDKVVKSARKEHKCDGCRDVINPGEKYRRIVYIDYDDSRKLVCMKMHLVCPHELAEQKEWEEQEHARFS